MISSCQICNNNDHSSFMAVKDHLQRNKFHLIECNSCGLVSIHPIPSDQKLSEYYRKEYYALPEKGIVGYLERKLNEAVFRTDLKHIERHSKRGKLLDIGSGNGYFLKFAKENNWQTLGVEMSPDASKYAREQKLEILNNSIEDVHLPKNEFEVITMFNVLEHMTNLNSILKKVRDSLKPNGLLVIEVPNIESLQKKVFKNYWCHLDVPRHIFHFKRKSFLRLVGKSGFNVVDEFSVPFSLHEVAGWLLSLSLLLRKKQEIRKQENSAALKEPIINPNFSPKFNLKMFIMLLLAHLSRIVPSSLISRPGIKTYVLKKGDTLV
jgi:SAM-dependent methyltransferase